MDPWASPWGDASPSSNAAPAATAHDKKNSIVDDSPIVKPIVAPPDVDPWGANAWADPTESAMSRESGGPAEPTALSGTNEPEPDGKDITAAAESPALHEKSADTAAVKTDADVWGDDTEPIPSTDAWADKTKENERKEAHGVAEECQTVDLQTAGASTHTSENTPRAKSSPSLAPQREPTVEPSPLELSPYTQPNTPMSMATMPPLQVDAGLATLTSASMTMHENVWGEFADASSADRNNCVTDETSKDETDGATIDNADASEDTSAADKHGPSPPSIPTQDVSQKTEMSSVQNTKPAESTLSKLGASLSHWRRARSAAAQEAREVAAAQESQGWKKIAPAKPNRITEFFTKRSTAPAAGAPTAGVSAAESKAMSTQSKAATGSTLTADDLSFLECKSGARSSQVQGNGADGLDDSFSDEDHAAGQVDSDMDLFDAPKVNRPGPYVDGGRGERYQPLLDGADEPIIFDSPRRRYTDEPAPPLRLAQPPPARTSNPATTTPRRAMVTPGPASAKSARTVDLLGGDLVAPPTPSPTKRGAAPRGVSMLDEATSPSATRHDVSTRQPSKLSHADLDFFENL